jgi:hypothetical protein
MVVIVSQHKSIATEVVPLMIHAQGHRWLRADEQWARARRLAVQPRRP